MARFPIAAVFAVLLIAVSASSADAKRGFRVPVAVAGMGSSETIEKVLDLPDIPALKRPDDKYVDIGYLH